MLCIPKSNHKKLIDECYPPAKMLAGIGPEYKANNNELSRLCHYANRKPAKLTKVGNVLQQRAASECKGVTGSGQSSDKAKGALMVTLAVTKELIVECHRDLNYFTSSAAAVIQSALQAAGRGGANGTRDLEISARAASTFYAFAVHMDSATASTDADARRAYSNLLLQFSRLAREKLVDGHIETKARLIGLGSFAGAISSDAFFNSAFSEQLACVLPALLDNLDAGSYLNESDFLQEEATKIAENGTASNKEFSAKRKAAAVRSIPQFAFNSEKSVSYRDVASAAMGNLHAILHYGDASNVQAFVVVFVAYLNGKYGTSRQWEHREWCCWITQSLCSWTALQYRFILLTHLVEHLVEDADGPADEKHSALIAVITTLLSSKLSMIGLSTSDTANNLLGYTVRRVHFAPTDALLGPLVLCVSSIATHIYYADQLNDMAEEICTRIAALELPEEGEAGVVTTSMDREASRDSIRVLLACLVGLMQTAHRTSGEVHSGLESRGPREVALVQSGTRNRISTSAWHQTASLLASPDYLVRQAYEEALIIFFSSEVSPSTIEKTDPLTDSLGSKLSVEATGFSHAFSAALYVLVMSKVLYAPNTVKESPLEALPIIDRSNKDNSPSLPQASPTSTALPIDFSGVIKNLEVMYERIPIASLLATVPALLAINSASVRLPSHRKEAVTTLLARALSSIGKIWDVSQLQFGSSSEYLPDFPAPSGSAPLLFTDSSFGESSKSPALNTSSVVSSLSNNAKVQSATGLDAKALQAWFARDWSVQIAVDDSFVGASPFTAVEDDTVPSGRFSLIPDRSARLDSSIMGASASSETSGGVGIGVDDFRQALGSQRFKGGAVMNGDVDAADKKASRRASRKISQPVKINGSGLGGLLDSMKVGVAEEEINAHALASPPKVA